MTELLIEHPLTCEPERKYIYDVIFGEFLGISYQARPGADPDATVISVCGEPGAKRLVVHEGLFSTSLDQWLTGDSLPRQPLSKWVLQDVFSDSPKVSSEIPVIYGQRMTEESYYAERDGDIELGLDIFGSAFFMLTRYEEVVKNDRDEHDRFPATASLAYQEGFLERPIINEYLEILWTCMKRLWPGLRRRQRQYRVMPSHDVDRPLAVAGEPLGVVLRGCAGDLIARRDFDLALRRVHSWGRSLKGDFAVDPINTFDFIMRLSEAIEVTSAFYLMATEAKTDFDRAYSTGHPWMRRLMCSIVERGHEIGFHGSYYSYNDAEKTRREVTLLRKVLAEEGIADSTLGGRQHYLRWQCPVTWEIWNDIGLTYDSTLTFARHVGFRCGICYEYPTFSVLSRRQMQLVERPLVIMDVALHNQRYEKIKRNGVCDRALELSHACKIFNGDFTILWHNSNLAARWQKDLYQGILSNV